VHAIAADGDGLSDASPDSAPSPAPAVAIVGAGALGLGIGSFLLSGGARVHFAAHGARGAAALRSHGLLRTGVLGERRHAASDLSVGIGTASLRGRAPDWVLVCTKTTAADEVAAELARHRSAFDSEPGIVLCVNGWGTSERFAARLPAQQIYAASILTGFRRTRAHALDVTVHAEPVKMGSLFAGADLDALAPLCAASTRGGLPCQASSQIESELWAKMLYNCALNPLGALIGVPYGVLGERAETRAIVEAVVVEIFALLECSGRRTRWRSAREYLDLFWDELLPATAAHESSMLQDLRAGRRSEIDALCGAVVALAQEYGVQTPVNAALYRLVRAREQRLSRLH